MTQRLAPIADTRSLGLALGLERIDVPARARLDVAGASGCETLLYVIRGEGSASVADGEHRLGPESVVWLEQDEACALAAGGDGLAVLAVRAPA